MTLYRLKSIPVVLIEDDINKNIKPILIDLVRPEENTVFFCYEQPVLLWRNVFKNSNNIKYYKFINYDDYEKYINTACSVIIDSVNQMALNLGLRECIKCLLRLKADKKVERLILVLHKDCLSHYNKLQVHLRHIVNAIVSYDSDDSCKVNVIIKKSNKITRSDERVSYDVKANILKLVPIEQVTAKDEVLEKPSPGNLTTFKIEVDQIEKMEKYKLKLPYMSKINEGESKVYYEPDSVDDWDEEDPDEDLDI